MSLTLDATRESAATQGDVLWPVPEHERERVGMVIASLDVFFGSAIDIPPELDKEMHPIQIERGRRGEIVRYRLGGAVVRSLEFATSGPLENIGIHDALALSIKAYPTGELESEKHRFAWHVLSTGERISAGRGANRELDRGDYRLLELWSRRMHLLD